MGNHTVPGQASQKQFTSEKRQNFPQKIVPDASVALETPCIQGRHAINRATQPNEKLD